MFCFLLFSFFGVGIETYKRGSEFLRCRFILFLVSGVQSCFLLTLSRSHLFIYFSPLFLQKAQNMQPNISLYIYVCYFSNNQKYIFFIFLNRDFFFYQFSLPKRKKLTFPFLLFTFLQSPTSLGQYLSVFFVIRLFKVYHWRLGGIQTFLFD